MSYVLLIWITFVFLLLAFKIVPIGALGLSTFFILIFCSLKTPAEAFGYIVSPNSIMIMSVLVIGRAIFTSGAGDVIGYTIRRSATVGKSQERIISIEILLIGILASSVLPNTAVTVAMLPAVDAVCKSTGLNKSKLYMLTAISTNLGGTTTLIGTTSNLTANAAIMAAGIEGFGFFSITALGLPIAIACVLFLIFFTTKTTTRTENGEINTSELIEKEKRTLTKKHYFVLFGFLIFVFSVILEKQTGIKSYLVGAVIATILVIMRIISEKEAIIAMDLGTTVFIASCLAFSDAFSSAGGADMISIVFGRLIGSTSNNFVISAVIFIVCCVVSQFLSNTAAASIIIPILIRVSANVGLNARVICLVAMIACNCSYLTPVASPTNILVSARGDINFSDWMRTGLPLTIIYFFFTVGVLPAILSFR